LILEPDSEQSNSEPGRIGGGKKDRGRLTLLLFYARGAQENLWPKSSLERPVARHFVCSMYKHMACHS
jgi:hypothetical protein